MIALGSDHGGFAPHGASSMGTPSDFICSGQLNCPCANGRVYPAIFRAFRRAPSPMGPPGAAFPGP